MSPAELATANSHLMARLMPFLANPLANTPISAFFYNDEKSRQRTINTDSAGHFSLRAALDFVPTHVRILASEKLSATEKVIITEPRGVSLISDIDDTIKHTAITSGAREIFRNAFIRELADLTIEGVKEWYSRLADMGVKFHYVSNSPWQLYSVLKKFISMAGLPPGSFHLKQYSGMLQGIFEPVAERKKSTLDRIARDFPERKFLLVGDSGEADLEVYTEFVVENPGRVLGVFIRDVTTPIPRGFFDSSMGPLSGERSSTSGQQSNGTSGSTKLSSVEEDHDPELKAAIAASLRDMEEQDHKMASSVAMNRTTTPNTTNPQDATDRPLPMARRPTEPPAPEAHQLDPPLGDLIEFSDDESTFKATKPPMKRSNTDTSALAGINSPPPAAKVANKSLAPMPPRKPLGLRSPSSENPPARSIQVSPPARRAPPPKPRRPSTSVQTPRTASPHLSTQPQPQKSTAPKPPISRNPYSYASTARQMLSSGLAHWHGTAPSSYAPDQARAASTAASTQSAASRSEGASPIAKRPPPPPPPRRAISSYPAAAAHYASDRMAGMWNSSASPTSASGGGAQQQLYSTAAHNSSKVSLGSAGGGGGGSGNQPVNKREELWRRRWERAERIMAEHGVVLKAWRVGTDVLDVTVRLVEEAKEREREEGTKERRGAVGGEG